MQPGESTRSGRPAGSLDIRAEGVDLDARLEAHVRDRVERWLARHGPSVQRMVIRLVDLNGPRGGVDVECRVEILSARAPRVFASKRESQARAAFDLAFDAAQVALARAARGRRSRGTRRVAPVEVDPGARAAGSRREAPEVPASLIGRREGRARENLLRAADRPEKRRRDVPIDTAMPGVSATDRRAGYGSTARRNAKMRAPKAAVMLEDSGRDRPSRKSTRRSAGRNRPDNPLYLNKRRGLRKR